MTEEERIINVRLSDYEQPGLYLTLKDSTRLDFTRENIEKVTTEYWMDSDKIPANAKKAAEFQRCAFCPLKGRRDLCDALRPTLPLLDVMDKYNSFDEVTAVYKGDEKGLCHVSYTSMQRALRYISNLSLMGYCQVGRKYWKYFSGTIPVMGTEEIANRVYLNIYWIHKGDKERVDQVISKLNSEIIITTQNQMERLRLICKNDALLNAFVLTHMTTDVLYENKDTKLRELLESFEKNTRPS